MLLSEMIGVIEGELFGVGGRVGYYKINNNTLMRSFCCDDNWEVVSADLVLGILLYDVPSGIIHLPPPLTDEQREQLKAIWTLGGRWLAKDMPGDTFAFGYTPVKDMEWLSWIPSNDDKGENLFSIYRDFDVCNLVSWSDPEPYDIGKALGVEE